MARDPEQLVATLRQLARLDPVELGQQAVLERLVQAAATCCASTGGVGLLLLDRDQQLCYVAAVGRPRRALAGSQVRLGQGPSVDAFLQDAPVASHDLAGESRWPDFRPLALAAGIRAWLSTPVRQRHGPIGALDFARTDPQPWLPQDLAAATGFARLLVATLRLATARQLETLSPALRFAVDHDARIEQARDVIMERERLGEVAAVELLRLQAQIGPNRSELSPNASCPAPGLDLHPPNSAPRWWQGAGIGPPPSAAAPSPIDATAGAFSTTSLPGRRPGIGPRYPRAGRGWGRWAGPRDG